VIDVIHRALPARSRSSGCIELRSKSSTIRRRPRGLAVAVASPRPVRSCRVWQVLPRPGPPRGSGSPPAVPRVWWPPSWKSKERICWAPVVLSGSRSRRREPTHDRPRSIPDHHVHTRPG
jgi:hypothetical protein